ncbi:hypothetical protein M0M57_01195 [Flavobacterium azooxidireducens]|uniref:DUF4251 domain-containing protein n=1 Tax=Flavobacterium azooxidireducens TaxID=1871076 RepID=A0ABY4KF98_9FLAO|nr:hypothetical protein [Flavobacterium azooxidireducens]UPQ79467.1 hypothetical protein M0M57_01195 [Flavobacterium azooxidireducens]
MKTKILKSVAIVLFMNIGLFSCSSDSVIDNEENSNNTNHLKPAPPGLPEFYYRHNGVTPYTSVPDAFASSSSSAIYAMDGSFNVIKIPLSSLAVGSYHINIGSNYFTYMLPTNINNWNGIQGSVKITQNDSYLISGNFKITGNGIGFTGVTSVNGYFNSVPILP